MAGLLFGSMRDESPTTDETVHLTRGVAFYWGAGSSLSYAHPPLGNALAALPIVLTEPAQDLTRMDGYALGQVAQVGRGLLEHHYEERRRWFFAARGGVAIMALGLGVYLYWLGATLFGPTAGLCALFFYALHPTLIAHGRLMTTDLPVTVVMMLCVGEMLLYLSGRARWHALSAALLAGIALATKYTALALLPVLGSFMLACALLGLGRFAGVARKQAVWTCVKLGLLVALSGLFVINAAYKFDRTGMQVGQILKLPEPMNQVTRGFKGTLLERRSVLKFLPTWLPVPVPYTYVYGMASISVHDRGGHSSTFFGKPQRRGHPAYFPVMLAIKTPLLLLGALAVALAVFLRRRARVSLSALGLGWYAGALLLLATRSSINIGVRHILPMMPALALLGGLGAAWAYRKAGRSQLRTGVFVALAAAHVWGLSWTYPDYISDFNALVGGRRGGEKISIIGEEWGQDMVRLGRELQARGVTSLIFNTDTITGQLELERFGVRVIRAGCPRGTPPGRWVAVNARERARDARGCWAWLSDQTPAFEVNNHVWVYAGTPAVRRPGVRPQNTPLR